MKFLYEENKDYATTYELFSQDEIKAHIARFFKDSEYYFQPRISHDTLTPRRGFELVVFCTIAACLTGSTLHLRQSFALDATSSLLCALFGLACVGLLLGAWTLVKTYSARATPQIMQKGKDKGHSKGHTSKKAARFSLPKSKSEAAYEELLGRGKLYEGKITAIEALEPPLRQITFTFTPVSGPQSAFFITESATPLEMHDTLVVLSNGEFTVLL